MQRLTFYMYDNSNNYSQQGDHYDVEIDDKTVIAITFQAYDLKKPAERLRNISNNFSIPATAKNLEFFGYPLHKNIYIETSPTRSIYNNILATYQLDNVIIFYKSAIRIDEISDNRISIVLIENTQIERGIELLKNIYWDKSSSGNNSMAALYFQYLNYLGANLPTFDSPFVGTWSEFYNTYIANNLDLIHGDYITNFYNAEIDESGTKNDVDYRILGRCEGDLLFIDGNFEYNITTLCFYYDNFTDENSNGYGGRFSIKTGYMFNAINWYYKTYLGTDLLQFDISSYSGNPLESGGGTFDESYIFCPSILVYVKSIVTPADLQKDVVCEWAFIIRSDIVDGDRAFAKKQDTQDKANKTAYDFLIACCQKFNWIVKEEFNNENKTLIKLYKFNEIDSYDNTNIIDWSNNFKSIKKHKPNFTDYTKNNIIYKEVFDGVNKTTGGYSIYSKNKNLKPEGNIIEIDAFYPTNYYSLFQDSFMTNLSDDKAFNNFVFLKYLGRSTTSCIAVYSSFYYLDWLSVLPYKLEPDPISFSDYGLLYNILQYPRYYEVEKWITPEEIKNLNFFNQYYFEQLGGSFYINRITGYNPMKSFDATTLELVQVSRKIPNNNNITQNAWVDGDDVEFTDGTGEVFTY